MNTAKSEKTWKDRLAEVFDEYRDGLMWLGGGLVTLAFHQLAGESADSILEKVKAAGVSPTTLTGKASFFAATLTHAFDDEIYALGITLVALGLLFGVIGRLARRIWKVYEPEIIKQLDLLKVTLLEAIRTSKLPLVIQGAEESEAQLLLVDMIARGYGDHCKNDDSLPKSVLARYVKFFNAKQPIIEDHARILTITPLPGDSGFKHWNEVTTYTVRCTALEAPEERRPKQADILPFKIRYSSKVMIDGSRRAWAPTDHTLVLKVDGDKTFDFSQAVTLNGGVPVVSEQHQADCKVTLENMELSVIYEKDLLITKASTHIDITETSVVSPKDAVIALTYPQPCLHATIIINLPPSWHFAETIFNRYGASGLDPLTWVVRNHPNHVLIAQCSEWVPPGLCCSVTYESPTAPPVAGAAVAAPATPV